MKWTCACPYKNRKQFETKKAPDYMQKLMKLLPTVLVELDAEEPLALRLAVVQSARSHWNDSSLYLRNREIYFDSSSIFPPVGHLPHLHRTCVTKSPRVILSSTTKHFVTCHIPIHSVQWSTVYVYCELTDEYVMLYHTRYIRYICIRQFLWTLFHIFNTLLNQTRASLENDTMGIWTHNLLNWNISSSLVLNV